MSIQEEKEKLAKLITEQPVAMGLGAWKERALDIDSAVIAIGWIFIFIGAVNLVFIYPIWGEESFGSWSISDFGVAMGLGAFVSCVISGVFFLALGRIIELLRDR